ncbi:MAG: hypothetical protein WD489_04310 [Rhodovibrionaceae bacterium]
MVTVLDWALLQQLGFGGDALKIGAITAVLPSLAVAAWIARSAYSAEFETLDDRHPPLQS